MLRRLFALAMVLSPCAGHAQEAAFKALQKEECRAIAARLAAIEATRLHGIAHPNLYATGPKGDLVVFINPVFSGFDFVCYRDDIIGVLVRSETPKPSNAWYSLAARVGAAVVDTDHVQEIKAAIRECHKEARGGRAPVVRADGVKIQCHVISGNDGDAGAEIYLDSPIGHH